MTAAQAQISEMVGGFVTRTRATAANQGKNVTLLSTIGSYTDRTAMETYLLAHGYTQTTLNRMNLNDIIYAVRLSQDPGTI